MNIFRISTLWVPDHHSKMDWKHPERTATNTWTIKALDGSILRSAIGLLPPSLLLIFFFLALDIELWGMLTTSTFVGYITYNATFQKRVFAIRLTEEGGEVCNWRAIPEFIFKSMPWLIGVYLLVILWGFFQSPGVALGALAGGAGMGIVYAFIATPKDYKDSQLNFQHWEFEWHEIYEAIYDRKSHAIGFNVKSAKEYAERIQGKHENFYCCRIYFHPRIAKELLDLFRSKLAPDTPIKEGRIYYLTDD